jgi:MFS family permease
MFGMRSIGKVMGWIGVAWFAGAAIGPLIGGTVYDTFGSYFIAFMIGAICMLAVILLFATLTKPEGVIHKSVSNGRRT